MIGGCLPGQSEDVLEGGECRWEWSSLGKWGSVLLMIGEMVQVMLDGAVITSPSSIT